MNTIIITSGISLILNLKKENINLKDFNLINYANSVEQDLNKQDKEKIDEIVKYSKDMLNNKRDDIIFLKKISAELNTILSYYETTYKSLNKNAFEIAKEQRDFIWLFTTDTYTGIETAKILEELLIGKGININIQIIKNLRANNFENFKEGIKFLHSEELQNIYNSKNVNDKLIFILTAGFKSWTGYMQTIGTLYADEILYQFEKSDEFFKIPKLPLSLNLTENQKQTLRLLAFEQKPEENDLKLLPETSYLVVGDEYGLDALGSLLWEKVKEDGFYQEIRSSFCKRIMYSKNFEKQYNELTFENKNKLAIKLDELAQYINNPKHNLKSLNFHTIKHNEKYNYEFYTDELGIKDKERCYLKEKNNIFEIVELGPHLK